MGDSADFARDKIARQKVKPKPLAPRITQRDRPGDIDRQAASASAARAAASLKARRAQEAAQRAREASKRGLVDRILGAPKATYDAVAQIAGRQPSRQTALRGGEYEKRPKQAAKLAYDVSPLKPFIDFAQKPGAKTGALAALSAPLAGSASPAVAITTKATQLRKALGLANDGRSALKARELAEAADLPMLQLSRDAQENILRLAKDPSGGIVPGGLYRIPAKSKFGAFVDNRTALLQDPRTGTIFVTPKVIHADMIEWLQKNLPAFDRGPTGYLQHELYSQEQIMPGVITPPRWMTGARTGDVGFDSEDATIARAALIQQLQAAGVLGDVRPALQARKDLLARRGVGGVLPTEPLPRIRVPKKK